MRDPPRVRDLLHDAAARGRLDLALGAEDSLEHEPQRLREARARPDQLGLDPLAARPRGGGGRRPPRASQKQPAGPSQDEEPSVGRRAGAREVKAGADAAVAGSATARARRAGRSSPGTARGRRSSRRGSDERPTHRGGRRPPRHPPIGGAGRGARVRHLHEAEHRQRQWSRRAPRGRPPRASRPRDQPYAGTWRSACRVSHSEAKPLSGGIPAIAIAPTRKGPPVHGIRRRRPPRRSSSSDPSRARRRRRRGRGAP